MQNKAERKIQVSNQKNFMIGASIILLTMYVIAFFGTLLGPWMFPENARLIDNLTRWAVALTPLITIILHSLQNSLQDSNDATEEN